MLEAVLCFAPSVVVLAIGVLMLPVWFGMLGAGLFYSEYRDAMAGVGFVMTVVAIVAVLSGILGIVGLIKVIRSLISSADPAPMSASTRVFVALGLVALVYSCVAFWPISPLAAVFVGVVPLVASGHIVYLARERLFHRVG